MQQHTNAPASELVLAGRTGYDLLVNSILNKGTAFSDAERDSFALHGLLPPHVSTLDEQIDRRIQALRDLPTDLDRYVLLRDLQDSNETLHYALLEQHIEELLPIVYTPTVGQGCQDFSRIFRKPRGLFLSPPDRDRIPQILAQPHFDRTEAIVVSDGERILGLGDQGAGGMGIPIGKLALYTACGGLHPATTLPILLDTGTDNEERLADPLYIGWRHRRVRGQEYDDFIESFVSAVAARWPHVLLQWEDFARSNANRLLERYRDRLCTFNDDIQGTAAVAIGTLLAAIRVTGCTIAEQRIAVLGAGSAGCGIAALLLRTMMASGVSEEEARRRFFLVDRDGLLVDGTSEILPFQQPFVQRRDAVSGWRLDQPGRITMLDVVRNAKPTVLIGVSGQAGAFTEAMVREMARHVERPVIFPLSNPTANSEATPADLLRWSDGRAIFGTGSPFAPVQWNGRTIHVDQTNNSYIFPGVGLGLVAARVRRVSDTLFVVAAQAVADASPTREDTNGTLLPPVTALRDVSFRVALAVARQAREEGLCDPHSDDELEQLIRARMWTPAYQPYRLAEGQG